jgi:hypothetical protein
MRSLLGRAAKSAYPKCVFGNWTMGAYQGLRFSGGYRFVRAFYNDLYISCKIDNQNSFSLIWIITFQLRPPTV